MSTNRRTNIDVIDPEEEEVDDQLVDETATWIRQKLAATIYRGAVEIGDFVLEKFFHGDPDRVRSRNPNKNASFRSLVARCNTVELPISRSTLHNAVALSMMRRLIPGSRNAFELLPQSHQTALLPLQDPVRIEKLAQRAASKNLTVRELRGVVAEAVAKMDVGEEKKPRRGKPVIVKTLDRSLKAFTLDNGRRTFSRAHVDELSDAQAREALKAAQELVNSVQSLIQKLIAKG